MAQTTVAQIITKVDELATEVGKEIKKTNTKIGTLTELKTTNKTSTVAAINEIKDALANTGQAFGLQDAKDGLIKDGAKADDTTYSSNKIEELITSKVNEAKTAVKADILDGADAAYDTLKEVQEKIKAGDSAATGILDALGNRLRIDEAMSLTSEQQQKVAQSLGIPTEVDFVATFRAQVD